MLLHKKTQRDKKMCKNTILTIKPATKKTKLLELGEI